MTRQFDFGNYSDVARLGVGDNILDLFLCVETAVRNSVADVWREIALFYGLGPLRSDLGQARILFDLDPPALVVRQMPVKVVELVLRHQIDVLLDEIDRHEVARDIEMHATVLETVYIFDLDDRYRRRSFSPDREKLAESLYGIKESGAASRRELSTVCSDTKCVTVARR